MNSISLPPDSKTIQTRRATILTTLLHMDEGFSQIPVQSINVSTLLKMFSLYDQLFFSDALQKAYGQVDVTLSNRLTSSAGKFIYSRNAAQRMQHVEIRMSGDFLFRLNEGPFALNGLSAATPQEAFLIVFEHELCHALENAHYGSTGHSQRFLSIANGFFGHTGTQHSLPTRRQNAAEDGLLVGTKAAFLFEGRELCGQITYIGKTATVMVLSPRGDFRDADGRRYTKYRVPLSKLRPC